MLQQRIRGTDSTRILSLELIPTHLFRMTQEALFLPNPVVSCLLSFQILLGRLATGKDLLVSRQRKAPNAHAPFGNRGDSTASQEQRIASLAFFQK